MFKEIEKLKLPAFTEPAEWDHRSDSLDNERTELKASIERANARLLEIHREEGALALDRSIGRFEHFKSTLPVPLADLLDKENRATYDLYRALGRLPGIRANGSYWTTTGQRVVGLCMHRHRKGEVEATEAAVRYILPHLKAEEGIVKLDIELGGSGIYRVLAFFDCETPDVCYVGTLRRGTPEFNKEFDSIGALLKYVQETHCYSDDSEIPDYL